MKIYTKQEFEAMWFQFYLKMQITVALKLPVLISDRFAVKLVL